MKLISVLDSTDLYGKERANIEVVRTMIEHGAEVCVLINEKAKEAVRNEVADFNRIEMPFPREIEGKWRSLKYIIDYLRLIPKMTLLLWKRKPDYILVPTEITLSYLFFPLLLSKVRLVFRCGDSPIIYRKHGIIRDVYALIWKYIILKRVDQIVCNALFLEKQLISSGRKWKSKDRVIYNYPPLRKQVNDQIIYRDEGYKLKIGFLGRIMPDKGVRELVEAVVSLNKGGKNVAAYIGGDIHLDEVYMSSIKDIFLQNPNSNNALMFVGKVNDLQKFYDNIDLIVIPSVYPEPMANVLTEAKYHHKAAIIFNLGGMPEIVEHLQDGYICQKVSSECLAHALKYYLDNPSEVSHHGEQAFESISRLGLTKTAYTQKWLETFEQ